MSLITLTTDLGAGAPEIAAVKGYILKHVPDAQIIDLSHEVSSFNYVEAAHVLEYSLHQFDENTLHIISVEGDFEKEPTWLLAIMEGQYILTKNNGLVDLASNQVVNDTFKLQHEKGQLKNPFLNVLARHAVHFINNKFDINGLEAIKPILKSNIAPIINDIGIRGQVVYVNRNLNVVTNIKRKHFEQFKNVSSCRIHYTRKEYFTNISNSYYDVPEGEAVCFFNDLGYLEIGMHGGNASNLLGLELGKSIWIELE